MKQVLDIEALRPEKLTAVERVLSPPDLFPYEISRLDMEYNPSYSANDIFFRYVVEYNKQRIHAKRKNVVLVMLSGASGPAFAGEAAYVIIGILVDDE